MISGILQTFTDPKHLTNTGSLYLTDVRNEKKKRNDILCTSLTYPHWSYELTFHIIP